MRNTFEPRLQHVGHVIVKFQKETDLDRGKLLPNRLGTRE